MEKLKPHSEVINKHQSVLVIGRGWVGSQVLSFFKHADSVDTKDGNTDIVKNYDFAFICVPTPPNPDGSCDTSIVESVIEKYKSNVGIFIIRSTVDIGFTDKMNSLGVKVVFQPEYLGETIGHPHKDGTDFVILGGKKEYTSEVGDLWSRVSNPNLIIRQTDSKTAELVKLMVNNFLSTKVSYVNQFYDIAQKLDISYYELRELWLLDTRINRDHTMVYPNNRGFGGKCLPKDLKNIINFCKENNIDYTFLKGIEDYNNKLRNQ